MKFLPLITIALWASIVAGYFFASTFLFQPIVVVPIFTILSIFIPICFWILQFEKKRIFSLVFIGIFIINGVALSYKFVEFANKFSTIEPYQSLVLDPQQTKLVFSGKTEQSRMNMSRHLYETSGVITAYKNKDDKLTAYSPTDIDKSVLMTNLGRNKQLIESKLWLRYYSLGTFLLLSIQVITFVGILIYLILLEGPSGRKPIKRY